MSSNVILSSDRCILRIGGYNSDYYVQIFGKFAGLTTIAALAKSLNLPISFFQVKKGMSIDDFNKSALPQFRYTIVRKCEKRKLKSYAAHIYMPVSTETSVLQVNDYNNIVDFFKLLFKYTDIYGTKFQIFHTDSGEMFQVHYLGIVDTIIRYDDSPVQSDSDLQELF